MKNLLLLFLASVLLNNCSSSRNEENVASLDASTSQYMKEIYPQNSGCIDHDYLKLTMGGKTVEINYNQYENGLQLCHFAEYNYEGLLCENCDGHVAKMQFPIQDLNITPTNFPVKIGSVWYADPNFKVTEINFGGLFIFMQIPARLTNNLKTGVYKLSTTSNGVRFPGVQFNFNWEIIDNSKPERAETGYGMGVDRNKPYKFELVCIDKSVPNKIRLTWKFNATFVGKSFESNDPQFIYSSPIDGTISYNIEL